MDVLEAIRDKLIAAKIDLSKANCYVSALTLLVPGSHPLYVQVVDNGSQAEGDQGGGTLAERISVRISVFVHMALDQPGKPEQVLIRESAGLRARVAAIREVLHMNWLEVEVEGAPTPLLQVPLYWQETLPPLQHPVEPQWVSQDLIFVGYEYSRRP